MLGGGLSGKELLKTFVPPGTERIDDERFYHHRYCHHYHHHRIVPYNAPSKSRFLGSFKIQASDKLLLAGEISQ